MNNELLSTQKINRFVLAAFLLMYPNMYLATVDALSAFSLGRLILLGVVLIFSLLSLKHLVLNNFFKVFIVLNFFFTLIQFFNPLEDEMIYTIMGLSNRPDGSLYQGLLLFFIIFSIYTLKNYFKIFNFLFILSLASVIHSTIVISQYINVPIKIFNVIFDFQSPTIIGLTGHAGFTAALIMIGIFCSLLNLKNSASSIRILSMVFLIINLFGLSMTQNRATSYAVTAALVIWFFLRWKEYQIALPILLSVFIANFGTAIIPNANGLSRDRTDATTFETRTEIWNLTLKLLPQTWGFPFWGGGTGAMTLTISEKLPLVDLMAFYQKEYKLQSNTNIAGFKVVSAKDAPRREKAFLVQYKDKTQTLYKMNLDRAHNFFLDKSLGVGLIGAILWMIFYIYPIYAFWRLPKEQRANFELQGLIVCLIAIQLYYIFWFAVMQVEPIHVVIALMAWVGIERAKATPDPQQSTAPLENSAPA